MSGDLHRFEANATLKRGEHELNLDRERVQLVRIVLTDGGPVIADGGDQHHRPDVVCPLRPSEARALAARLLELADHATTKETAGRAPTPFTSSCAATSRTCA